MNFLSRKADIIHKLKTDVLSLQGFKRTFDTQQSSTGLGPIEKVFPNKVFPLGAVHEFISPASEDAAATNGFICGIIGKLTLKDGICFWIGTKRTVFPSALKAFGIAPHHIIFIDVTRQKDALWAIEEALKCEAVIAVVGELKELSFTESRRLQLAVEKSKVTGFIHRVQPKSENTVACISRWKIKQLPSEFDHDMPGVGYPRWDVQLLKVRNGKPGRWAMEWSSESFKHINHEPFSISHVPKQKIG